MSRIADALGRAGRALPVEDGVRSWESGRQGAEALLKGPSSGPLPVAEKSPEVRERLTVTSAPVVQPIHREPPIERISAPVASRPPEGSGAADYELVVVVRHVFLFSRRPCRRVLFCSPPGDPVTDVAWQAAEVLAAQSGRRVAFVDAETENRLPAPAGGLITRVAQSAPLSDLGAFDFVIVNGAAQTEDSFMQTAREVDGVLLLVTENATRRMAAEGLVATLRRERVNLLGVILVQLDPS